MLKYKEQIQEHITNSTEQLEGLVNDIEFNRINKVEHQKRVESIINRLNHLSDLVDLEEG
tara:strand:+ start:144 stop:323 length:180 start_codon:yes stop_codon:yes gene_type:complete